MEEKIERAKELGVKSVHLIKKEATLDKKIAEAEAALAEDATEDTISMEELVEDVLDVVEEVADDEELVKKARALQTEIGFKTKAYLQFVADNEDAMPSEYALVANLIEKFLCRKY